MASAPINPSRFNQLEIEEFLSRADRFVGEHRESSPKSAAGKTFRQLSRYLWVSEQVLRPGRPFNELFSVLSGNRKALLRGALGLEKNAQSMWLDSQADAFFSKSSLRAVYVARPDNVSVKKMEVNEDSRFWEMQSRARSYFEENGSLITCPAVLGQKDDLYIEGMQRSVLLYNKKKRLTTSFPDLARAMIGFYRSEGAESISLNDPRLEPFYAKVARSIEDAAPEKYKAELSALLEQLKGSRDRAPFGFCHGDLGTSNILITPKGKLAVIDWDLLAERPLTCDFTKAVARGFVSWSELRASFEDAGLFDPQSRQASDRFMALSFVERASRLQKRPGKEQSVQETFALASAMMHGKC